MKNILSTMCVASLVLGGEVNGMNRYETNYDDRDTSTYHQLQNQPEGEETVLFSADNDSETQPVAFSSDKEKETFPETQPISADDTATQPLFSLGKETFPDDFTPETEVRKLTFSDDDNSETQLMAFSSGEETSDSSDIKEEEDSSEESDFSCTAPTEPRKTYYLEEEDEEESLVTKHETEVDSSFNHATIENYQHQELEARVHKLEEQNSMLLNQNKELLETIGRYEANYMRLLQIAEQRKGDFETVVSALSQLRKRLESHQK